MCDRCRRKTEECSHIIHNAILSMVIFINIDPEIGKYWSLDPFKWFLHKNVQKKVPVCFIWWSDSFCWLISTICFASCPVQMVALFQFWFLFPLFPIDLLMPNAIPCNFETRTGRMEWHLSGLVPYSVRGLVWSGQLKLPHTQCLPPSGWQMDCHGEPRGGLCSKTPQQPCTGKDCNVL